MSADLNAMMARALARHEAGDLAAARAGFEGVLVHAPRHAPALHQLGLVHLQEKQPEAAIACLVQAASLDRRNPDILSNLGEAYRRSGLFDEALEAFGQALRLAPGHLAAQDNRQLAAGEIGRLAMERHKKGDIDAAAAGYRLILKHKPDDVLALYYQGVIAMDRGQPAEAVRLMRLALPALSHEPEFHCNLGLALRALGESESAGQHARTALGLRANYAPAHMLLGLIAHAQSRYDDSYREFQAAIASQPDYAPAHNNLGNLLVSMARYDDAITACRRALQLDPRHTAAHVNLGNALRELGRRDEGIQCYRRALELDPRQPEAFSNLGSALNDSGRPVEGLQALNKAAALDPRRAEYQVNIGVVLKELGDWSGTIRHSRRALELNPNLHVAQTNIIFARFLDPEATGATLLAECRDWDERHGRRLLPQGISFANTADPDRRLRIGYVSPDFRDHAVAYFLEPMIVDHDPASTEIFCYDEHRGEDDVTRRIRAASAGWRLSRGITDEALARQIREDRIDILVDCAGHTAGARLRAFAMKPAPIQVATVLGAAGTTGLATMDYLLTDSLLSPPGTEDQYTETLLRLPRVFSAFRPYDHWPAPFTEAPPQLLFGFVGHPARCSGPMIELWRRILDRVPGARLLIKHAAIGGVGALDYWRAYYEALGERVVFEDVAEGWPAAMTVYGRISIALDSFPANNGTSSLIPLWMGVPVVTRAGGHAGQRVGASLLTNSGFPELVAGSDDDYVDKAVALALDRPRLAALRARMRDTMQGSPICDRAGVGRELDAAWRGIWRSWCAGQRQGAAGMQAAEIP